MGGNCMLDNHKLDYIILISVCGFQVNIPIVFLACSDQLYRYI